MITFLKLLTSAICKHMRNFDPALEALQLNSAHCYLVLFFSDSKEKKFHCPTLVVNEKHLILLETHFLHVI